MAAEVAGSPAGITRFQRLFASSLVDKHDAITQALEEQRAAHAELEEQHSKTETAYKDLHRSARKAHVEKTKETFSMEQQLEYAITTELKLRAEVERLERKVKLTQHDLGNARFELASLGESWRLDEDRALDLVRTHELGHLQLCDHVESAVDSLSRWRADGERLCAALHNALEAVSVQRQADEEAREARELKAVGGTTRGLGDAAEAEQRELEAELQQQGAFVGEIEDALLVWEEREKVWAESLPGLRAEFAGALYAAQLHQQQELSALLLKSPSKRAELQARIKEIHDHQEAVCGVWPNLNVGYASPKKDEKKGAPATSPQRAGKPGRDTSPPKPTPKQTPKASPKPSAKQTPKRTPKRHQAVGVDAPAAAAAPPDSAKRLAKYKAAPQVVATPQAESQAIVIAAGSMGALDTGGKRPGSAASLSGSVPEWTRPDSPAAVVSAQAGLALSRPSTPGSVGRAHLSRPSTPGSVGRAHLSRPSTPGSVGRPATAESTRKPPLAGRPSTAESTRRPPTPEQVALQPSPLTAPSTGPLVGTNTAVVTIDRSQQETGVWGGAGRPDDQGEMVREMLVLQGVADVAEATLPPVLLLARADTVEVGRLAFGAVDPVGAAEEDEIRALRLNRLEWGTEEWSQSVLPVRPPAHLSAHFSVFRHHPLTLRVLLCSRRRTRSPRATVSPRTSKASIRRRHPPQPLSRRGPSCRTATLGRWRCAARWCSRTSRSRATCCRYASTCSCKRLCSRAASQLRVLSAQIFEPGMRAWTGLPRPLGTRQFPVLLGLADGGLLLLGGYDKAGSLLRTTEILRPRAVSHDRSQTFVAELPCSHRRRCAAPCRAACLSRVSRGPSTRGRTLASSPAGATASRSGSWRTAVWWSRVAATTPSASSRLGSRPRRSGSRSAAPGRRCPRCAGPTGTPPAAS